MAKRDERTMPWNIWVKLWNQYGYVVTCRTCGYIIMPDEDPYVSTEGGGHRRIYRHHDCYERLWITLPAK